MSETKPTTEIDLPEFFPKGVQKQRGHNRKPSALIEDIPLFIKVENFIQSRFDLQFNEVSNEIEFKAKEEKDFRLLNENNLFRVLQHNNVKMSMANLMTLLRSDFVPVINPFHDYFTSLPPWKEGDPDHIEQLANHLVAHDQLQFNHHFKKMLVRCIGCALVDTYFNKHALVLVGKKQNTGKSTFIRFLCPPRLKKYISENISFQ